jgi:hypothetical protein
MILKKSVTTIERNEKGYAQHYDITAEVKINPISVKIIKIVEVNTLGEKVINRIDIESFFRDKIRDKVFAHYENKVDWESVYNEHLFELTHGDK